MHYVPNIQPNNKVRDLNAWFPESRNALKDVLEIEKEAALYEADGPCDQGTIETVEMLKTEEVVISLYSIHSFHFVLKIVRCSAGGS